MTSKEEDGPAAGHWVKPFPRFSSDAIHIGQEPEQWNAMMLVPPISMSTTFKQTKEQHGFEYGRSGNPTRKCLERSVATLESAKHGLAYSSGLGALASLIQTMESGDHVILTNDIYGGTYQYFKDIATKFGIEFSQVDFSNIKNLEKAIKENTKLIWIETPTNPTLKVIDIRVVAEIAKKHKDCLLAVDNTFMSPYFQRPLTLGADVVMHSASKYINGHSDVIMGLLITNDDELYKKLQFIQYAAGSVPSPFDCYLVNRGIKTLALRMEKHQQNAVEIAKYLEKNENVEKVSYPGLASHPQHELIKKQATGCSGMISFWIKGNLDSTMRFLNDLKLISFAASLGGFHSLIEHPASTSHVAMAKDLKEKLGITDNFIRLSVGLEDVEDLIKDLKQAFQTA